MSKLPSLPLFVDDYEAATAHLSMEEDGCYTRLLRLCWRTPSGTIPQDHAWIRRRMRVDQGDYDRVVMPLLDEFFVSSKATNLPDLLPDELLEQIPADARFLSPRLVKEYHRALKLSAARREAGSKGGTAKASKTGEKGSSKATNLPKQTDSSALPPIPIPIPTLEIKEEPKGSSKKTGRRGTRLPDDWILPAEWLEWAASDRGWPLDVIRAEAEQFRDYWCAKPGREGTKTDWLATWRNWCRNSRRHPQKGSNDERSLTTTAATRRPDVRNSPIDALGIAIAASGLDR